MPRLTQGIGSYQFQLSTLNRNTVKNDKKNVNSINLMNTLDLRPKKFQQVAQPRPKINPKQNKQRKSIETEPIHIKNQSPSLFENTKFKPNNIKISLQNRGKKSNIYSSVNETKQILIREKGRFSLDKEVIVNKPSKNLPSQKKKYFLDNQGLVTRKLSPQKKEIYPLAHINYTTSLGSNCIFSKSKRILTSQQEVLIRKDNPGPGQYNLFKMPAINSASKFGHEDRLVNKINPNPGPDFYSLFKSQLSKKGGVITRQKRYSSCQNSSPGPANYQTVSLNKIRPNTMCVAIGRSESKQSEDKFRKWPGPGDYEVKQTLRNSRVLGGAIGKSKRDVEANENSPGPSIYSPKYEQVYKKSPTFVIGKEIKETSETKIIRSNHSSSTNKMRITLISAKNMRLPKSQASEDSPKVGQNLKSKSLLRKSIEYK